MMAILGGGRRTIGSPDFRGGSLVALLGGYEIDLRSSSISGREAGLGITVVWGGVDLRVPEDWRVECRGVALLGGLGDKTQGRADSVQQLVITGLAVMGGVSISN
jgi:predicted membrane protein